MLYALGLYVTLMVLIGFKLRKHQSGDEFLIGRRRAGWLAIAASVFTLIGGGELATMATLAYTSGAQGIYLFVGYSLGFILLAFLSNKLRSGSDENLFHSLPDYFYNKHGKWSGLITTILSFVAFFALLVIQFTVGALLISEITTWSYSYSVFASGALIAVYLILGGFKSVLATDVIQGLVMLVLLPTILWFVRDSGAHGKILATNFESLGTPIIISLIVAGVFTAIASADVWQRIYAAKDGKNAQIGLWVAAILFIAFGFGIIGLGVYAKGMFPDIDPNNAFISGISSLLPTGLASIVLLMVFSAILSTADTEVFLLSSMVSRELKRWQNGYKSNYQASKETKPLTVKLSIVAITILALVVSLFSTDLLNTYTFLLGVIMIMSPPLIVGLFRPLSDEKVVVAILASVITFVIMIIQGILTIDNLVIVVIPSILITIIMAILPPK